MYTHARDLLRNHTIAEILSLFGCNTSSVDLYNTRCKGMIYQEHNNTANLTVSHEARWEILSFSFKLQQRLRLEIIFSTVLRKPCIKLSTRIASF